MILTLGFDVTALMSKTYLRKKIDVGVLSVISAKNGIENFLQKKTFLPKKIVLVGWCLKFAIFLGSGEKYNRRGN